jgi:predicted deacylase
LAAQTTLEIGGQAVRPGRIAKIELPIARLMSGVPVTLPLMILHGRKAGPTMWVSAAIHGDEVVGVEIIRQTVASLDPKEMAGTVIAAPVVNVHGFNAGDRYFPDRRDLNRAFPGSKRGSLASRVARLMMTEVVGRCQLGIDLHSGSDHRTNLPQIRADLDDPATVDMANAFGAPVAIHAKVRDGSLRQAATEVGATVLLYEAGEAHRFDRVSIDTGVEGVMRVVSQLGIATRDFPASPRVQLCRSTKWARAGRSGVLHLDVQLGTAVEQGELIATIYDTYGKRLSRITSRVDGVVIGHTQRPLVNRGDAVVNLGQTE